MSPIFLCHRFFCTDFSKRLIGAVLLEQNDEWSIANRYMPLETIGKIAQRNGVDVAPIPAAIG